MSKTRLSDLQTVIMNVLWEKGEATVSQVREALSTERDLAPTTVGTVLSRLEDKGVVGHRSEGRQYVYRPEISRREVRSSMVGALVDKLFQGDSAALVHHLIHESDIDPNDLDRLERLVEKAQPEETDASGDIEGNEDTDEST